MHHNPARPEFSDGLSEIIVAFRALQFVQGVVGGLRHGERMRTLVTEEGRAGSVAVVDHPFDMRDDPQMPNGGSAG